jgi:hypothetical protein
MMGEGIFIIRGQTVLHFLDEEGNKAFLLVFKARTEGAPLFKGAFSFHAVFFSSIAT